MKVRSLAVILTIVALPAAMGACGEMSDNEGDWVNGGSSTSTGSSSTSSSSGSSSGAPETPAPIMEPTCEGIDQSEPVVLYLSADDSNSMSSAVHAREALRNGQYPGSIRTYEFLNYYNIDFAAPSYGSLAVIPSLQPGSEDGTYDMQIGVRSFDAVTPRRPMTITFVLDTSGSMAGDSITRERAVVKAVAASLAEGDIVNMVTWNTSNNVVLSGHSVTGPNDETLLAAAENLSANGGTDLNSGLTSGYELANTHYGEARLNRLILISDGGANVGITDEEIIALHSEDGDQEGIYLVGVGTGPVSGYNDTLMDQVTDKGRGAYVYIDSVEEAHHMFVERFDEVMEVAARAVQVELTLPWYFQMYRFYGEEYSEDPEEVEPQHLAPGDAMIFQQVIKSCAEEAMDLQDTVTVKLAWQTPLTYLEQETSITVSLSELLEVPSPQLDKGRAIVAYAEALKTGTAEDLTAALALVEATNPGSTDPELTEIAELIAIHPALF